MAAASCARLLDSTAAATVGLLGVVIIDPIGGRSGAGSNPAAPRPGGTGGSRAVGPLNITLASGEWVVTESTGTVQRIVAESIDLSPEAVNPGFAGGRVSLIALNGAFYPGRLRLVARTDLGVTSFDIVETVPLETYLKGVVVKEMYPNWPLEAFRVQAICARSYALHERARGIANAKPYDVEASQRDQAYSGATGNQRAIQAVESTRGIVLAFESSVLRAYYSSSCGGRSGGARDTWPITRGFEYNLAAPIQAYSREFLCDRSSPQFKWVVQRDREELIKRLRAYGETNGMLIRKIENISSLEVLRTAATGRPSEYKIVEPGGRWFQLKAEDLRLACNTTAPGLAPITSKDRVLSGDITIKATPAKTTGGAKPKSPVAGTVEISGRGFGHGVGMCQYCVKAMADRGDEWRKMTMLFYPGAEIVRAYK